MNARGEMVNNNDDYINISKNEYDDLLQKLKIAEIEKNKSDRELRNITKRYEIDKHNIETQLGLNRIVIDEKLIYEMYVHLLLESWPDPMFLFDENTNFLLGTKAITDFISINDISILQKKSLDSIVEKYKPPALTDKITALVKELIYSRGKAEPVKNFEITIENNKYELNILPFHKDNGDFAGVLVILHDITEIVKAREIAEHASSAKGEFLSRMSHEMRTPLNAIIGMINIGLGTEDIEKKNYCFKRADSASKHLLGVINDILDMSKIEAEKFELSFSEFDFEQALKNITNMANVRVEEKQQNFIVNLAEDVPPKILADELRLSQVITNLLTNAIKFTPVRGTVKLNIEKIEEINDEITLRVEVSDTGIGISKEQQGRLFTSFNQADSSISQNFGGTGLGLAISKRIVSLMGGRIWIESELGKGAKFIFTINVKKAGGKERSKILEKIDKAKIRILAVDDSEEIRNYFLHVMGAFKLSCDIASGGPQAIHLIKNAGDRPYNILFIDWQMPDMNGIELTKRIKEINDENSVVIMTSANDWNAIEKDAVAVGVKYYISKPLFPSTLINAISICMGLKIIESTDETQHNPENRQFDFHDRTILIAEDVEINREIMSAILEETNISIDYAENGKISVAMFSENPEKYDLILMDINMPEMDGYEATKKIRSLDLPRAKNIPIIAMTANVFKEDIEKCIASGMNDHTGKPIDADALFELLDKYLTSLEQGIAWDDDLITGNSIVDSQHHEIFELLSNLVYSCEDGSDIVKLEDTLMFLVQYTIRHFVDEEALQHEYNYPGYDHHRNEHALFRETVTGLVQRFKESGSSAELSGDVNKIVVRWLVNHIQNEDKKMSEYIRKAAV